MKGELSEKKDGLKRGAYSHQGSHCAIFEGSMLSELGKYQFPIQTLVLHQPVNSVSYIKMWSTIRAIIKSKTEQDNYHLLSREQQVVRVRLCTRQNRRNACMNHKFELAPSPTCCCGQEDNTAPHVLQRWPLLQVEQQHVWLTATPLTSFFTRAGVTV